jgi:hypothetical protein
MSISKMPSLIVAVASVALTFGVAGDFKRYRRKRWREVAATTDIPDGARAMAWG